MLCKSVLATSVECCVICPISRQFLSFISGHYTILFLRRDKPNALNLNRFSQFRLWGNCKIKWGSRRTRQWQEKTMQGRVRKRNITPLPWGGSAPGAALSCLFKKQSFPSTENPSDYQLQSNGFQPRSQTPPAFHRDSSSLDTVSGDMRLKYSDSRCCSRCTKMSSIGSWFPSLW